MTTRSYVRGWAAYFDGEIWRWESTGEPAAGWSGGRERPCRFCARVAAPSDEVDGSLSPDPCLGFIPGVTSACCGHGIERGYLQLANGTRLVIERVDVSG